MNVVTAKRPSYPANTVEMWSDSHTLIMMLAVVLSAVVGSALPLALVGLFSFSTLIFNHLNLLGSYKPFAGLANWLTLIRLLVVMFAVIQFKTLDIWLFFSLMTVAVLMDVADGIAARALHTDSEFGRAFDMEVDAFFVMAMGLYFLFTTDLGLWLLIPGLMRYIYRFVLWLKPKKSFKETKQKYAAVLAGMNFTFLLVAVILPVSLQTMLLIISTLIVVLSFSISFFEYFKHA